MKGAVAKWERGREEGVGGRCVIIRMFDSLLFGGRV